MRSAHTESQGRVPAKPRLDPEEHHISQAERGPRGKKSEGFRLDHVSLQPQWASCSGAILLLILSCGEHIAQANGVLIQTSFPGDGHQAPGAAELEEGQ